MTGPVERVVDVLEPGDPVVVNRDDRSERRLAVVEDGDGLRFVGFLGDEFEFVFEDAGPTLHNADNGKLDCIVESVGVEVNDD